MWTQETDVGGGFIHGDDDAKAGSSSKDAKDAQRTKRNIVSVNVAQILNLTLKEPKANLVIHNCQIGIIKTLGRVISVNEQTTKLTFVLKDDSGGQIDVEVWNSETSGLPIVVEDTYVTVHGTVRVKDDCPYIAGFKVTPISSINEIPVHSLQVMYDCRMLQAAKIGYLLKEKTSDPMIINFADNRGHTFDSNNGYAGKMDNGSSSGLTSSHRLILKTISNCHTPEGISVDEISRLLTSIDKTQLRKHIEYLSNEGHIYSTIDENHFRSTDNDG